MVEPDAEAVAAFWATYCAATGQRGEPEDVFGFGDSPELADELLALVLDGPKRATAGAVAMYRDEGAALTQVGDRAVLVDGRGQPRAVIEATQVRVGPLGSVDDAFAWDEGEGDRTRASWLAAHRAYFRRWAAATGRVFDDELETVFQRFALVWPR